MAHPKYKAHPLHELQCAIASGQESVTRLLDPPALLLKQRPELKDLPLRKDLERIRASFELCRLLAEALEP